MGAIARFGLFELDLTARELRKRGIRLHLPVQSFEILAMLVERPGDVVTREEIRERLWPHGTVVEFDHSVNSAVKRLRDCLGDSGTSPRFIETLPRRGYRLVIPVETAGIPQSAPHFRILGELGRGGMGVVYKAEDQVLGRTVALKFLPDELARHPPSLERFRLEARTLAALNHPGICALFGIEEHEGRLCLIMEYLDGQPLGRLIETGPLGLKRALEIAIHASEAVAAAHSVGIVHHDITPANIFVSAEAQVKILDFGLAEMARREPAEDDASARTPAANPGVHPRDPAAIDGTTAYLSPEQVEGKSVDARADVYALGVVLYEMLCGKSPFGAGSNGSTPMAILKEEPLAPRRLRPDIPANVEQVLLCCLEKRPEDRYSSAGELCDQLKSTLASIGSSKDSGLRLGDTGDACIEIGESAAREAMPTEAALAPRHFSVVWLAAYVTLAVLAGVFIGMVLTRYLQPASPVVTSTIKVEPGHWLDGFRQLGRPSRHALAISRDGTFIVYSAIEEDPDPQAKPQLYLRRMDQPTATPIRGTEGGIHPFLSPDNRWVGFWAGNKLMKVPVEGGAPNKLCDTTQWLFGASWGPNNSIVFTGGRSAGLSMVSADGGAPEPLTSPDPNREYCHSLPSWLPNEKAVLFTVMRQGWDYRPWVAVLRLDTRERHVLLQDAADARYVPTGHLVFLQHGTLMAVRFDPASLEVIGQPQPLRENVMQACSSGSSQNNTGAGQFAISDTGALIYAAGSIVSPHQNSLVWVDRKGTEEPVTDKKCAFFAPRLSPDGQRIAYGSEGWEDGVWVYDLNRGTNSMLTGKGKVWYPIWTPDGKWLLFDWIKSTVPNLFRQPYDASAPMEQLTMSANTQYPGSWSSDGNTVALVEEVHLATRGDVAMLDLRSGRVTKFLNSPANERFPEFSPVGPWLAYTSDESGSNEVYVRPFPGPDMRIPISGGGGVQPLWAKDGKQLFYRWGDQVWAVDIRTDGGFTAGKPRMLFDKAGYSLGGPVRSYDLSLDGKRFLMVKLEQRKPEPVTEMILVQNWFEELKRLAPTGKN